MTLYEQLRKKHPTFIYHSYEFLKDEGNTVLRFHFSIDEYDFTPQWSFPFDIPDRCNKRLVEDIAFSLGMAELVSYWKCCCAPNVEVRCGYLTDWQKNWWKKLYFNGLGEFFYRNGITPDFDSFMTISSADTPAKAPSTETSKQLSGILVPIGGGKDSVVSVELLKSINADIYPYIINPRGATLGCVEAAEIPSDKTVGVRRTIDKTLLELNKQGYLNGHTPFSAVVAFSAELFAAIKGYRYIALSNESSANEAYVDGTTINHQYSKSTEFERDFREYCETSYSYAEYPEYFSLLRAWSEWQIAREFVKHPQYFSVFQSCNLGSKTDVWCGECAKCLYVYILLAAFLTDDVLVKIFGCNMLEKQHLSDMFDGLVLDGEDKPFECVGTRDEIRLSLEMALKLRGATAPVLLRRYAGFKEIGGFNIPDLDKFFDNDNFIPAEFLPLLKGD